MACSLHHPRQNHNQQAHHQTLDYKIANEQIRANITQVDKHKECESNDQDKILEVFQNSSF